jgi:hypothetical protein
MNYECLHRYFFTTKGTKIMKNRVEMHYDSLPFFVFFVHFLVKAGIVVFVFGLRE